MTSTGRKIDVVWLGWKPTPYNDYLFHSLSLADGVDLHVFYRRKSNSSHPWKSYLGDGYRNSVYQDLKLPWCMDLHLLKRLRKPGTVTVFTGWPGLTSKVALLLTAAARRPFFFWTDTPKLLHRTNASEKPVECFESGLPYSLCHRAMRNYLYQIVFKHAVSVMATGAPGVKALLRLGCPRSKLVSFPFFVPVPPYKPRQPFPNSSGHRPVVFLGAGQLVARKGYSLAVRALACLRPNSKCGFKLWLAGEGPERPRLEALIQELNLHGCVEILGWKEPTELESLRSQADVFVHPATCDPFPVAVLEAMASGLPVIGSDAAGSVVDRVQEGISGFVHKSGDLDGLRICFANALADPERLQNMGFEARRTAEAWPVERGVEHLRSAFHKHFAHTSAH